jgi:N-acyl-L-homoserine lactone synthetase
MTTLFADGTLSIVLLREEPERHQLRALFRDVAQEQGWDAGGDLLDLPVNSHLIAVYADGQLHGGIELRKVDLTGRLPICEVWPELNCRSLDRSMELVLLALDRCSRGKQPVLWALCIEMWRFCLASECEELLVEVPVGNLRLYERLGWCPEIIGPERKHWGETCYPCRIGIATVAEAVLARARRNPSWGFVARQALR